MQIVYDFYIEYGLPEERTAFIAGSYQSRLELLQLKKGVLHMRRLPYTDIHQNLQKSQNQTANPHINIVYTIWWLYSKSCSIVI